MRLALDGLANCALHLLPTESEREVCDCESDHCCKNNQHCRTEIGKVGGDQGFYVSKIHKEFLKPINALSGEEQIHHTREEAHCRGSYTHLYKVNFHVSCVLLALRP